MRSLAGRVAALVLLVAVCASAVTAVALWRAFLMNRTDDALEALRRDAALLAAVLAPGDGLSGADLRTLRGQLSGAGVVVAVVPGAASGGRPAGDLPTPLDGTDVVAVVGGQSVDGVRRAAGTRYVVTGRRVGDDVLLLAQEVDRSLAMTPRQRRRLVLGGLAGLAAGALAGLALVRAATGPLRGVAGAARRMAAGERGVRVPVGGPSEVTEVADALNALGEQLEAGEERQRAFLMAVSHELRTPLTAVTGYAETLADGGLSPGEVSQAATVIHSEAGRLARRIEDLLTLARLDGDDFPLSIDSVDAAAVVAAAARAWQPRAAAIGVVLRADLPPAGEAVTIHADGERLRQIVDALCDNALRVLPPAAPLVIAARREGPAVVVEVRDGGPGLDDADLAVAFERGRLAGRYRGVRRVGSGLGLALVGGLARRMGGQPSADRAAEGGLRVAVRFPVALSD